MQRHLTCLPEDPEHVEIMGDAGAYWTGKFGCSREELEEALKAVGSRASDVEAYITGT